MSRKKRKVASGTLPVDCVGEICEFVCQPSVFLKLYTISHHVKWYFDQEHPFACENVEFIACKKGVEVMSEKKYVIRVTLLREISLRVFPNLKCLTVGFRMNQSDQFSFYSVLPELKYVEEVKVGDSSPPSAELKLTNECLSYFRKLKRVNLYYTVSWDITDEGIKQLECVEDLRISSVTAVTGSAFEFTKNLRKLKADCTGISDESMSFLHQIEDLNITQTNISTIGMNNLPETVVNTLHTLSIQGCRNISNSDITRFKLLKHLIDPFEDTNLSCDVLKSFPKLEKITLWPQDSSVKLGEIADNVTSEHFNELYITLVSGVLASGAKNCSDHLESLKKFKNLTKLTISYKGIDKECINNIARCENLEILTINRDIHLTTEDLNSLKKMKSLRKVICKLSKYPN